MKDSKRKQATPETKPEIRGSNGDDLGVKPENKTVCDRLNDYREKCGMSVQALADASDVPFSTVRRYLRGQVPNPQLNTVLAMAEVLEMPLDLLFEGTGDDKAPALEQLADLYMQAIESARVRDARNQGIIKRLSIGILVLGCACLLFMSAWAYLDITNGDVGIFRYPEGSDGGLLPWIVIGLITLTLLLTLIVFIGKGVEK